MEERENAPGMWHVLTGEVQGKKAERIIRSAVKDLHAFLENDPLAEERIGEILSMQLQGTPNETTWSNVDVSLVQYFGDRSLALLLYWVVEVDDPTQNRTEDVREIAADIASDKDISFLRSVVGVYGPKLSHAWQLENFGSENWKHTFGEIYWDLVQQTHVLSWKILKYNGESIRIQGPLVSFVTLLNVLMDQVSTCIENEPLDPELAQECVRKAAELVEAVQAAEAAS